MVVALAEALDVPLRDRNTMLAAAGFAAIYRETSLASPDMAFVRNVLGAALRATPYPAVVIDRRYQVLLHNDAAARIFACVSGVPYPGGVVDVVSLVAAMRPYIENWCDVCRVVLARARREADAIVLAAFEAALGGGGVDCARPESPIAETPALAVRLRKGDLSLSLFSMITTVGTPQDITLQELRIETLFPIDAASERTLSSLTR